MTSNFLGISNQSAWQYNDSVAGILCNICKPLFSNLGFTIFGYAHFFNDGTYLDLCTDSCWQKHYIEYYANTHIVSDHIRTIYNSKDNFYLWNNDLDIPRESLLQQFIIDSCRFNIWHGFSIYKKHTQSIEAWHFATIKENFEIKNFYPNNIKLLEHFIQYFQHKAADIINCSDLSKRITLKDKIVFCRDDPASLSAIKIDEFMTQTSIKGRWFHTERGPVHLAKRETECVLYLVKGKTSKDIANNLGISARTVEACLANAKKKLNCFAKGQLIDTVTANLISV